MSQRLERRPRLRKAAQGPGRQRRPGSQGRGHHGVRRGAGLGSRVPEAEAARSGAGAAGGRAGVTSAGAGPQALPRKLKSPRDAVATRLRVFRAACLGRSGPGELGRREQASDLRTPALKRTGRALPGKGAERAVRGRGWRPPGTTVVQDLEEGVGRGLPAPAADPERWSRVDGAGAALSAGTVARRTPAGLPPQSAAPFSHAVPAPACGKVNFFVMSCRRREACLLEWACGPLVHGP